MGAVNMQEIFELLSGKRVFVTGHTGFKGTWLTFLLKEIGAEVLGYALPPEPGPNHFELLKLDSRINHVIGDIRDTVGLNQTMQSFKPEFVFHLAAQALVKKSYIDPVSTFATNVMGSINLLDAVRSCDSVRSLVYITSDKCYENVEWVWGYRENDKLGGRDPYSASKASAEMAFSAYARSYFAHQPSLGAATTRAGNVIGGGDWAADRIIPDCIRALENKQSIQLRHPQATRPWQHVLEPISGYLLLAARLYKEPTRYAGSWNFGPPTTDIRTVREVVNSILQHYGQGSIDIQEGQSEHHEAQLLQLNCDKAHQLLGWYPRWHVDKTFKATALWYKSVLEGDDVSSVTRGQLMDYFPELL
jgi:CDP-glucose 4,6-dehydratase